ncbi:hypothetical protein DPMN_046467 [Dreissena polymorpha]|uniref:Uncharacterized protein n=1 Tax=Dreissena polymorpha TaxID=45954 RepID=A0A9D4HY75_DREPO|nr:hypothetical protein DPMN_046467 [Dreissena polymorpha]
MLLQSQAHTYFRTISYCILHVWILLNRVKVSDSQHLRPEVVVSNRKPPSPIAWMLPSPTGSHILSSRMTNLLTQNPHRLQQEFTNRQCVNHSLQQEFTNRQCQSWLPAGIHK